MNEESQTAYINLVKSPVGCNLPVCKLVEIALARGEGILSATGALSCKTGKYTGRSPQDRFIVDEPSVHSRIAWGKFNKPLAEKSFEGLYQKALAYLGTIEYFIFDGFAGADEKYRLPVRVINEFAWHNIFAQQLLIRPTVDQLADHQPEFTVICTPGLKADPQTDGTNSEAFIVLSLERRIVFIGGTE